MRELAKKVIDAEHTLNKYPKIYFLGSLLADHLRYVFLNNDAPKAESKPREVMAAVKLAAKFLFSKGKNREINSGTQIVFAKSGQKFHHHQLMDYLGKEYNNRATFFDKGYKEAAAKLSFGQKLKIVSGLVAKVTAARKTAEQQLAGSGLTPYSNKLVSTLTAQIIKFEAAKAYLQSISGLKLVVVDYDRSTFSALVLAANQLNIKTVSFQHGAINPPYGYVPLIANEIWVWGNTWKKSMMAMDVPASKIHIVGSTIVEHLQNQKSGTIKTIGIGPNPIGFNHNFALWNQLTVELTALGYKVIVKLHPSMKADAETVKIFGSQASVIDAADMTNTEFLNKIDLLIISNSGLGYEAILANVPVAVKRQDGSIGNDDIMITEGAFPEMIPGEGLKEQLLQIQQNYKGVLASEQDYVSKNIYQQTGNEARLATIQLINKYTDGVVK